MWFHLVGCSLILDSSFRWNDVRGVACGCGVAIGALCSQRCVWLVGGKEM